MVNQKEIAKRLGVSRSLVSMALNNRPGVKQETREKILATIKKLNYRPSLAARSLALTKKRSLTIVFISLGHDLDFSNNFSFISLDLLGGVHSYLKDNGYNLNLYFREPNKNLREIYLDLKENYRYDGVIFLQEMSVLPQLVSAKVPYVVANSNCLNPKLNCVYAAGTDGICQAAKHLISLGHKMIGYIGGDSESNLFKERLKGYRQAILENGISYQDFLIRLGAWDRKDGYLRMKELLSQSFRPTAVVADNDFKAIGAIEAVKEAGLKVPEDIAVIGFDDIPLAVSFDPSLTTVYHPRVEIGREATKIVLELINGQIERKSPIRINLSTHLVIRKSCGAN